jgi:hypothetical protein
VEPVVDLATMHFRTSMAAIGLLLGCSEPHARHQEGNADPVRSFLARFDPPSPATVLQWNDDGTVLISATPRFHHSELGCTMLRDQDGNSFANVYELLCFKIQDTCYEAVWSSLTSPPPVALDHTQEYEFLVSLEPQGQSPCTVLKVLKNSVILYAHSAR